MLTRWGWMEMLQFFVGTNTQESRKLSQKLMVDPLSFSIQHLKARRCLDCPNLVPGILDRTSTMSCFICAQSLCKMCNADPKAQEHSQDRNRGSILVCSSCLRAGVEPTKALLQADSQGLALSCPEAWMRVKKFKKRQRASPIRS